jgi:hypothetical protein
MVLSQCFSGEPAPTGDQFGGKGVSMNGKLRMNGTTMFILPGNHVSTTILSEMMQNISE